LTRFLRHTDTVYMDWVMAGVCGRLPQ